MIYAGGVDWGTVPAWVGSILTGGSLLLGFSILWRDRERSTHDQANQLSAFINPSYALHGDKTLPGLVAFLHNSSDHVIYRPRLEAIPLRKYRKTMGRIVKSLSSNRDVPPDVRQEPLARHHLHPHESVVLELRLVEDFEQYNFVISFQDAQNRGWLRHIGHANGLFRDPVRWQSKLFSLRTRMFLYRTRYPKMAASAGSHNTAETSQVTL